MYKVLDKDIIEMEIICHIPANKRGFSPQAPLEEIVNAILYKLKTGVQWYLLPVEFLFSDLVLSWQSVYYHYRKWCKAGVWSQSWIQILHKYRYLLDLSSSDLDGSHTGAIKGGEQTGYQKRKKRKTTNSLYLTDRQGLPLSMSEPVSGNHHDLFEIETHFNELVNPLEQAGISLDGLFVNADAGFDSQEFRQLCSEKGIIANFAENPRNGDCQNDNYFDELLYRERYSIERTNAWLDGFRSLLNRFDTTVSSWKGFNYLAFIVIGLKKFLKRKKFK